jgi:hypothetical protein
MILSALGGLFFITFSSLSRRSGESKVSLFGVADCSFEISSGNFKYKKNNPNNHVNPVQTK